MVVVLEVTKTSQVGQVILNINPLKEVVEAVEEEDTSSANTQTGLQAGLLGHTDMLVVES